MESATVSAVDGLTPKDMGLLERAVQFAKNNPGMIDSVRMCNNTKMCSGGVVEVQIFFTKPAKTQTAPSFAEKAKTDASMPIAEFAEKAKIDASNTPGPFKFDVLDSTASVSTSVSVAASSPLRSALSQVRNAKVVKVVKNALSARSGGSEPQAPSPMVPSTRTIGALTGIVTPSPKRCASRSPSPDAMLGESLPPDAASGSGEVKFKLGDRPTPDVPLDDPRWKRQEAACEADQRGGEESSSGSGDASMGSSLQKDVDWPALIGLAAFSKQRVRKIPHIKDR